MSAYLYYRRADPVLTDRQYDALVPGVIRRWEDLTPTLRWQLGTPEALASTGHHIKITPYAEDAAVAWFKARRKGGAPGGDPIVDWEVHPEFGRWASAEP